MHCQPPHSTGLSRLFHPRASSCPAKDLPRFPILITRRSLPAPHVASAHTGEPGDPARGYQQGPRSAPGSALPPSAPGFPSQVRGPSRVAVGQVRQVSAPIAVYDNAPRKADVKVRIEGPHPEAPDFVVQRLANLANRPGLDFRRKRRLRASCCSPWPDTRYQPVISCPFSGKVRTPTEPSSVPGFE